VPSKGSLADAALAAGPQVGGAGKSGKDFSPPGYRGGSSCWAVRGYTSRTPFRACEAEVDGSSGPCRVGSASAHRPDRTWHHGAPSLVEGLRRPWTAHPLPSLSSRLGLL